MSERIDALRTLIERQEKCRAKHVESAPIHETFEGARVWEGVVKTFQLEGHPTAKRAYAWVSPASPANKPEYTIVLGVPPVTSANAAVKAAIVSQVRKVIRLAEQSRDGR